MTLLDGRGLRRGQRRILRLRVSTVFDAFNVVTNEDFTIVFNSVINVVSNVAVFNFVPERRLSSAVTAATNATIRRCEFGVFFVSSQ